MKKKKVTAPVYETWQGNEYTDRAKQDVGAYGDWIGSNWNSLVTAPTAEDYSDIVNKAYNTTWNDFLDRYNTQANAIASRNYNRFGGLNSTPALYTQDMYNKQMNDEAARLASQMYMNADQLAGNQFNRNLTSLGTVYDMFNNAGNVLTASDLQRLQDVNRNIEAQYAADVQNANRGGWSFGNMLSGAASGAAQGGSVGGGWGALAGGILGGVTGGLSGYSNASGDQASQLGSTFGNIGGNTTNWLRAKNKSSFTWK